MKDGFIKAAAASPSLRVADCAYNRDQIIQTFRRAQDQGAALRQPVYVVAQTDPRHGRSSLRRKSSQARSMSSGVVILMFS